MACAPISASRGWRITPAPASSISSASCCSPIITAMSTNSSTGRALQLGKNGYVALSGAGGLLLDEPVADARERLSDTAWRRHQMPAYHLIGREWRRDHAGQHRRRPVERQDDLRSPGGAAPGSLADDRPLRRPARDPADRRLCAGPCLSARRPCARYGAAARNPDSRHRRSAGGAGAGRRDGQRRCRGRA